MSFKVATDLYKNKKYREAIKQYQVCIKEEIELETSYYNIGVCYIRLEDYKRAIFNLRKAIGFTKKNSYFYNIGYCYNKLDDLGSALYNFILANALNPYDLETKIAINVVTCKIRERAIEGNDIK